MLFDSLAHVTPDARWFGTNLDAGLAALQEQMRKFDVSRTVLSGLLRDGYNEFMLEVCRNNPEMFYGVPMLAYGKPSDVENVVSAYNVQGVKAIKIHPRFINVPLSDSWIDIVVEICSSYGMIVFLCTVDSRVYEHSVQSVVYTIGRLCMRHKNVKFVLLHGGYNELLMTCEIIKSNENVIVDISATLTRFYDSSIGLDIKYLCRKFDKRLVIGTDFPEYTYEDVRFALNYIGVSWTDVLKNGILGLNLQQFLGV